MPRPLPEAQPGCVPIITFGHALEYDDIITFKGDVAYTHAGLGRHASSIISLDGIENLPANVTKLTMQSDSMSSIVDVNFPETLKEIVFISVPVTQVAGAILPKGLEGFHLLSGYLSKVDGWTFPAI